MLLIHLDEKYEQKYTLEVSTQGHSFMTLVSYAQVHGGTGGWRCKSNKEILTDKTNSAVEQVVSFLLVSRVNIGLGRYHQARDYLGAMYREERELIQNMAVFSNHCLDRSAKEWRSEVSYRAMILLKTCMAVIDYPSTKVPAWDIPELTGDEERYIRDSSFGTSAEARRWAHAKRSEWEETMRVVSRLHPLIETKKDLITFLSSNKLTLSMLQPIHIAYLLRKSIHTQTKRLRTPLVNAQENKLLGSVDSFMGGYYGIRKFLTTPVPFPLIQMARTFVFLYLFTVPFVLLKDDSSNVAHCLTVFLMTYGFMGLEVVAIELDDPFGKSA